MGSTSSWEIMTSNSALDDSITPSAQTDLAQPLVMVDSNRLYV